MPSYQFNFNLQGTLKKEILQNKNKYHVHLHFCFSLNFNVFISNFIVDLFPKSFKAVFLKMLTVLQKILRNVL